MRLLREKYGSTSCCASQALRSARSELLVRRSLDTGAGTNAVGLWDLFILPLFVDARILFAYSLGEGNFLSSELLDEPTFFIGNLKEGISCFYSKGLLLLLAVLLFSLLCVADIVRSYNSIVSRELSGFLYGEDSTYVFYV